MYTGAGIIRAYNPPWWKQFSCETEYSVIYICIQVYTKLSLSINCYNLYRQVLDTVNGVYIVCTVMERIGTYYNIMYGAAVYCMKI